MSDIVSIEPTARKGVWAIFFKIANNFWLRRILKMLFTTWIVITIIFFIIRLMPGNPLDVLIQELVVIQNYSLEDAQKQAASMMGIDLNEPILQQYFKFLGNLLQGNFGTSYRSAGVSVNTMIAERLPWTLFSVGVSLFVSFIFGLALGMTVAYRRNTWIDHFLTNLAAVLDAIPGYLTAILVFILLGMILKVVPIQFMRGAISSGVEIGFTSEFILDALKHVAVPALVYVLATAGAWMLIMKSSTISTLGEDYVTTAKARGLSDGRIITAYVGRNAMLPLVTRLAITIGALVGGSILIETIFTYRGIGLLLAGAMTSRDYPLMQGVFIITTIAVIVANFAADLLYGWLDPRIRTAGGN